MRPAEIPVGLPSDLLRRRPDIREAERALAAATARVGVAEGDLFPRFSLTGSFGFESNNFGKMFSADSRFWSIGPAVRWPIFDANRIRYNIKVENARQEQALALYEKSILTSLEDVENAIVNYAREQDRRQNLVEAEAAAQRAMNLANELYSRGLTDFLSVLDAQRSLYAIQELRAQSDATVMTDLIALYKSLGGDWENETATADAPVKKDEPGNG
jgi:NodT family efflux transporter outer membrane factor (OMF) lipoprotein